MRTLASLFSLAATLSLAACGDKATPPADSTASTAPASKMAQSTPSVAMVKSTPSVAVATTAGLPMLPKLMVLPADFGTEEEDTKGDKVLLFVEGEVYKRCGAMKLPAPNFPLDSSKIEFDAADELRDLGRCLTTDPYDKMTVVLIGRTDPRGDRTYNKALGERRAQTVKSVLVKHGVAPARIVVKSAGEPKPGVDVRSYDDARRVDIALTQAEAKLVK